MIGTSSGETRRLDTKANILFDSSRSLTLEVNRTLSHNIADTEKNISNAILKSTIASLERDNTIKKEFNSTTYNMYRAIQQNSKNIEGVTVDINKLGVSVNNRFSYMENNISSIYVSVEKNKEEFDIFYQQVNEAIKTINNNFKELENNLRVVDEKAISNYEAISRVDIDLQEVKTIQLKQEQRDIGTLVWAYECDDSLGLYELDGSKYQDEKLADYLYLKDLQGFSVEGDIVDTPNLKGRFLGYAGALGVGSVGTIGADKTAVNGLNIQIGVDTGTGDGDNYKYWAVGGVAHPRYGFVTMDNFFYQGDSETMPNWYALKLCIKGKY